MTEGQGQGRKSPERSPERAMRDVGRDASRVGVHPDLIRASQDVREGVAQIIRGAAIMQRRLEEAAIRDLSRISRAMELSRRSRR